MASAVCVTTTAPTCGAHEQPATERQIPVMPWSEGRVLAVRAPARACLATAATYRRSRCRNHDQRQGSTRPRANGGAPRNAPWLGRCPQPQSRRRQAVGWHCSASDPTSDPIGQHPRPSRCIRLRPPLGASRSRSAMDALDAARGLLCAGVNLGRDLVPVGRMLRGSRDEHPNWIDTKRDGGRLSDATTCGKPCPASVTDSAGCRCPDDALLVASPSCRHEKSE